MTPDEFRERYPEGSVATHDANGKPLIGPVLGPDGVVYQGAPGEPPSIAREQQVVSAKRTRYNSAFTLAYVVISDTPEPTEEERMEALRERMQELEMDPNERHEALMSEAPFDTFEVTDVRT